MKRILSRLRITARRRVLRATTFCESCGSVCTAACRSENRLEGNQIAALEARPTHF